VSLYTISDFSATNKQTLNPEEKARDEPIKRTTNYLLFRQHISQPEEKEHGEPVHIDL